MTARRFGVLHRRLMLPVLIVMGGLQVMMRCSLILRGGLKMVAILAAMVSAGMLRLVAHDCVPGGVSSLKARPLRALFTVATTVPKRRTRHGLPRTIVS